MLVVAKKPRIRVEIKGRGVNHLLKVIKNSFQDVRIEEDETVPIRETSWWKEISEKVTPADALRVYRDNAALTLKELSKKTGIAVPHLSAMENEKRNIGKISTQKLGKALNCNYKRFL